MKQIIKIFILHFVIFVFFTSPNRLYSQNSDSTWAFKAREFIKRYFQLDFDYCYNQFDEAIKKSFSLDMLKQAYSQTEFRYGKFLEMQETEAFDARGYHITSTEVKHQNGSYIIEITYGSNGLIQGFYFKPPKVVESKSVKVAPYVDTTKISSLDIEFGSKFKLKGKLTLPKQGNNFPVLILVHGSGPNDMDETIGPNKPFKDLAEGLATQGIAVLRYNKRTYQYAKQIAEEEANLTLIEEVVDDVVEAYKFLEKEQIINKSKIFVLGHSLGGYAIPLIAQKLPNAFGYIILAGSNQPLEDKIVDQYQYISKLENNQGITEEILNQIKKLRDKIKQKKFNENTPKDSLLLGVSPKYWQFLLDYKPLDLIKNVKKPFLVLQGARDYQVTIDEYNNWKQALSKNSKAKFVLYDDLNHLFMTGKGMATPDEYLKQGFVDEKVIKDISNWILSH